MCQAELPFPAIQVSRNPAWFVALVWGEVLFQLPFFFIGAYAFAAQKKWIRIPALASVARCHCMLACKANQTPSS